MLLNLITYSLLSKPSHKVNRKLRHAINAIHKYNFNLSISNNLKTTENEYNYFDYDLNTVNKENSILDN